MKKAKGFIFCRPHRMKTLSALPTPCASGDFPTKNPAAVFYLLLAPTSFFSLQPRCRCLETPWRPRDATYVPLKVIVLMAVCMAMIPSMTVLYSKRVFVQSTGTKPQGAQTFCIILVIIWYTYILEWFLWIHLRECPGAKRWGWHAQCDRNVDIHAAELLILNNLNMHLRNRDMFSFLGMAPR